MNNDALSTHIHALISAAKSATSPITLKSNFLKLAELSQLSLDNDFLLYNIAGPLAEAAKAVFGPLSSLLVLTERHRRQVVFAVLARLVESDVIDVIAGDETTPGALLHHLLTAKDKDLIAECYGACPPGYLSLIRRSGEVGLTAAFYTNLHDLLTCRPEISDVLVEAANSHPILSLDMLQIMRHMPPTRAGMRVAIQFGSMRAYTRFKNTYRVLTKSKDILPDDFDRIAAGESPAHVINALYMSLPFPEPILKAEGFHHIANGKELFAAAKEFENCLRSHLEDAQRGTSQYYIVRPHRGQAAVICLNQERLGWHLAEAVCRRNSSVPDKLMSEINEVLLNASVRCDGNSVADWMAVYNGDEFSFSTIAQMELAA